MNLCPALWNAVDLLKIVRYADERAWDRIVRDIDSFCRDYLRFVSNGDGDHRARMYSKMTRRLAVLKDALRFLVDRCKFWREGEGEGGGGTVHNAPHGVVREVDERHAVVVGALDGLLSNAVLDLTWCTPRRQSDSG